MRAIVVVLCAAIAVTVAFGRPALAEPPFIAACGLIRAFTPPSPTAPGSITVGVRTSALTAADHFAQAAFGGVACLNQRVTTSGPVLEVVAVPVPFCGEMLAVGPSRSTSACGRSSGWSSGPRRGSSSRGQASA